MARRRRWLQPRRKVTYRARPDARVEGAMPAARASPVGNWTRTSPISTSRDAARTVPERGRLVKTAASAYAASVAAMRVLSAVIRSRRFRNSALRSRVIVSAASAAGPSGSPAGAARPGPGAGDRTAGMGCGCSAAPRAEARDDLRRRRVTGDGQARTRHRRPSHRPDLGKPVRSDPSRSSPCAPPRVRDEPHRATSRQHRGDPGHPLTPSAALATRTARSARAPVSPAVAQLLGDGDGRRAADPPRPSQRLLWTAVTRSAGGDLGCAQGPRGPRSRMDRLRRRSCRP